MKCGHGTDKINTKESSGMKKSRIMKTTVFLLVMVLLMGVLPTGCAGKESSGQGQVTGKTGQEQETGSSGQEQATGSAMQGQEPRDGTFQPSLFRAEGGTGKVKITCEEVTVKEGAAEAVIEFSSPHYEWVKKDDVTYEPENADEEGRKTSRFRIPVLLDEEQAISALTTAMSQPHEIEYTICVSLTETEGEASANGAAAGGEAGASEAAAGQETPEDEFSDEEAYGSGGESARAESAIERDGSNAPLLPGLTFRSAMEPEYAGQRALSPRAGRRGGAGGPAEGDHCSGNAAAGSVCGGDVFHGAVRCRRRAGSCETDGHGCERLVYRRPQKGAGERRHAICGKIQRAGL